LPNPIHDTNVPSGNNNAPVGALGEECLSIMLKPVGSNTAACLQAEKPCI
jgi:hypothetical protein